MILKRIIRAFKDVFFPLKFKEFQVRAKLICCDSDRVVVIYMRQLEGDEDAGKIGMEFDVIGGTNDKYEHMTPGEKLQYEFLGIILNGLKHK